MPEAMTSPGDIDLRTVPYRELMRQPEIAIQPGHRAGVLNVLSYIDFMAMGAVLIGLSAIVLVLFVVSIAFGNALVYGVDTLQAEIAQTIASIDIDGLKSGVAGILVFVAIAVPLLLYFAGCAFGFNRTTSYD